MLMQFPCRPLRASTTRHVGVCVRSIERGRTLCAGKWRLSEPPSVFPKQLRRGCPWRQQFETRSEINRPPQALDAAERRRVRLVCCRVVTDANGAQCAMHDRQRVAAIADHRGAQWPSRR